MEFTDDNPVFCELYQSLRSALRAIIGNVMEKQSVAHAIFKNREANNRKILINHLSTLREIAPTIVEFQIERRLWVWDPPKKRKKIHAILLNSCFQSVINLCSTVSLVQQNDVCNANEKRIVDASASACFCLFLDGNECALWHVLQVRE